MYSVKTSSPKKIESLQAVRTMAFIGIFLHHAYATYMRKDGIYKTLFASLGTWGVSVFFVLSGFVMVYSYLDRQLETSVMEASRFAIKKVARIYPLHLIMLIIGGMYAYSHGEKISVICRKALLAATLFQSWFPDNYQAINTVAWYLSVTLFLYFIFPFVLKKLREIRKSHYLLLLIVILYLLQIGVAYLCFKTKEITGVEVKWIVYCHPMFRSGDFISGCCLGFMYKRSETKYSFAKTSIAEILAIVISAIACYINIPMSINNSWFTFTCLFVPSSLILVYVFSYGSGIVSKIMVNKWALWIAALSPYGFLIHRIMLWICNDMGIHVFHRERYNKAVCIALAFLLTIALSQIYKDIVKRRNN